MRARRAGRISCRERRGDEKLIAQAASRPKSQAATRCAMRSQRRRWRRSRSPSTENHSRPHLSARSSPSRETVRGRWWSSRTTCCHLGRSRNHVERSAHHADIVDGSREPARRDLRGADARTLVHRRGLVRATDGRPREASMRHAAFIILGALIGSLAACDNPTIRTDPRSIPTHRACTSPLPSAARSPATSRRSSPAARRSTTSMVTSVTVTASPPSSTWTARPRRRSRSCPDEPPARGREGRAGQHRQGDARGRRRQALDHGPVGAVRDHRDSVGADVRRARARRLRLPRDRGPPGVIEPATRSRT